MFPGLGWNNLGFNIIIKHFTFQFCYVDIHTEIHYQINNYIYSSLKVSLLKLSP